MKIAGLYTIAIVLMTSAFLTYASRNWGGPHWPLFDTEIDRLFYDFGYVFKYVFILPILVFLFKDLIRLRPLTLTLAPLMAAVVWFCISAILWVIQD